MKNKLLYVSENFEWKTSVHVRDIVTDGEVQHMRKTSFQQEYISMVHNLLQELEIDSNKLVYTHYLKNYLTNKSMKEHIYMSILGIYVQLITKQLAHI